MKKDMQVKEEIMEQELAQVAGGVNVTKVVDTVTKVVGVVGKVLPCKDKKNDGSSPKTTEAPAAPGGTINQTTTHNTQSISQNNVNNPNTVGNIAFGTTKAS